MLLLELFDDDSGSHMIDQLRGQVMDYLTPLAAKKVEFIPIQDIADILRQARTGLVIDRNLIMQLIEPNTCKFVAKIEGDKVYLTLPVADLSAKTDQDKERDQEKIANTAANVAKQEISK